MQRKRPAILLLLFVMTGCGSANGAALPPSKTITPSTETTLTPTTTAPTTTTTESAQSMVSAWLVGSDFQAILKLNADERTMASAVSLNTTMQQEYTDCIAVFEDTQALQGDPAFPDAVGDADLIRLISDDELASQQCLHELSLNLNAAYQNLVYYALNDGATAWNLFTARMLLVSGVTTTTVPAG